MRHLTHILTAAALLCPAALLAQPAASTEYFLDHHAYIYRFNPALTDTSSFFFLGAVASHLTASAESNIGVSNLLFPMSDGSLVTGLNSQVSAEEFLGGLKNRNSLGVGADINLFSLGRNTGRHLTTVELNLRSNTHGNIPKSMFSLLKEGSIGESYDITDVSLRTSTWLEGAVGFNSKAGDITYGFRVKFLAGMADLTGQLDRMSVVPSTSGIAVEAYGSASRSEGILNDDGSLKDFNPDMLMPMGTGFGADLGVAYNGERFRADAAILDIGAIKWHCSMCGDFSFASESVRDKSDIMDIAKEVLKELPAAASVKPIGAIVNVGGRYFVNDWLSAGVLCTARLDGSWYEARTGVTMTPGDAFSFAASAGFTGDGPCLGAALNLRLPGVQFHLAVDDFIYQFTPQYIPVNSFDTTVSAGLALCF